MAFRAGPLGGGGPESVVRYILSCFDVAIDKQICHKKLLLETNFEFLLNLFNLPAELSFGLINFLSSSTIPYIDQAESNDGVRERRNKSTRRRHKHLKAIRTIFYHCATFGTAFEGFAEMIKKNSILFS